MENKGYIHIYTGNGQGKTTAAFGLAVRALGAGKRVYIGQFIKSIKYNETDIENLHSNVKIEQFGRRCFIDGDPTSEDFDAARQGWKKSKHLLHSGQYDLVILDELNIALHYKLLDMQDVIESLQNRRTSTEVIITGRYAPQEIIDIADLVTDMREIKHYYTQGILSRNGFDK